jgi:CCR4-NOT transcription complex subunit 9
MDHPIPYNAYQRALVGYSETPPLHGGGMGTHQPHFMNAGMGAANLVDDNTKIFSLVVDLMDPETREAALLELSKKREQFDDLALILWHSFGLLLALPTLK